MGEIALIILFMILCSIMILKTELEWRKIEIMKKELQMILDDIDLRITKLETLKTHKKINKGAIKNEKI